MSERPVTTAVIVNAPPEDIWPWLVGMVAVLLIPEIALRRIGPVGLGRLWSRLRAGRAKGGSGNESADGS